MHHLQLLDWFCCEGYKLKTRCMTAMEPTKAVHLLLAHLPITKDNILPRWWQWGMVQSCRRHKRNSKFSSLGSFPQVFKPVMCYLGPSHLVKVSRLLFYGGIGTQNTEPIIQCCCPNALLLFAIANKFHIGCLYVV